MNGRGVKVEWRVTNESFCLVSAMSSASAETVCPAAAADES